MHYQYRIFLMWFGSFAIAFLTAMLTQHPWAINACLGLLICLGLIMMVDALVSMYRTAKSKYWPSVCCDISDSGISYRSGGSDGSPHYRVRFTLLYRVNDKAYESTCSDLNIPIFYEKEKAEAYVAKVHTDEMRMYYNSENPEQAYVKPGIKWRYLMPLIFGMGMVLVPYLTMAGVIVWQ